MKKTEATELKNKFLKKLNEHYNSSSNSRPGIHVSDLIYCLRQSFYRKNYPKPHSTKTLQFFVDGARRHEALQELLGVDSEVKVKKFGVVGSIDILTNYPVEIKTTRAKNVLPSHYFKQLGYYCIMCGVSEGYLIVQRINCKNNNPWEFYHIQWNKEEITKLENELREKAKLFSEAMENKNPCLLPKIEQSMRWKCRYCSYQNECLKSV